MCYSLFCPDVDEVKKWCAEWELQKERKKDEEERKGRENPVSLKFWMKILKNYKIRMSASIKAGEISGKGVPHIYFHTLKQGYGSIATWRECLALAAEAACKNPSSLKETILYFEQGSSWPGDLALPLLHHFIATRLRFQEYRAEENLYPINYMFGGGQG